MHDQPDHPDRLPEPLADALRDGEAPPPVPEAVDRVILDQARAHFAGRAAGAFSAGAQNQPGAPGLRFPARRHLWWAAPLAAAAVIVISLFAVQTVRMLGDFGDAARTPVAMEPGSPIELAWDADRSGRLDILDVMILAKRREAGDAHVTPAILDDLTARIVALDRAAAKLPGVEPGIILAWAQRPASLRGAG